MPRNLPPHENYRDDEPSQIGSDRAFGCTVGGIAMAIGAIKAAFAATVTFWSLVIFMAGAVLLGFGLVAPARLHRLNRLWMRLGAVMAAVVNPVVMAVLFVLVVTPMAWLMRLLGKRPLHLAADPAAASYWIARDKMAGQQSSMRRQF